MLLASDGPEGAARDLLRRLEAMETLLAVQPEPETPESPTPRRQHKR